MTVIVANADNNFIRVLSQTRTRRVTKDKHFVEMSVFVLTDKSAILLAQFHLKKLIIQNKYEDAFEIEIAGTAKVLDLKKIIADKIKGITVYDQVLKFRSAILNDSDTIQSFIGVPFHVTSMVELTLQNCFRIFIKTEENRIHQFDVNFTNTIGLVKKMLNHLLKIDVEEQCLMLHGNELKNSDTLGETSIKPGTTIILTVKILNLHLYIVEQSGKVEHIEMPSNSTVAQLKQAVLTKYKVPIGYQILTYNAQVLDKNDKTLADYNVEDLSEINFRQNDFEIFIQCTAAGRNRIALRVLPIDNIGQVKDKIATELKISKKAQQIIWSGCVLGNDAILSDENIRSGSTLSLVVTVQNIKLDILFGLKEKIPIDAQSTETVVQLKTKLLKVTEIPIDQQILFADNIELEDSKMLINYGITDGFEIALKRKDSFEIIISYPPFNQIDLCVHKTDSVNNVKARIERRLNIKKEKQRLLWSGRALQDGTLATYGIEKECIVYLAELK